MNLSALLDKLNSLFSKSFIFAAFAPTLVFGFVNGLLLYGHSARFAQWAADLIAKKAPFDLAVLTIGAVVVAYLAASVNVFFREALEGKYLSRWLGPARARQQLRRDRMRREWKVALENNDQVRKSKDSWTNDLREAAILGLKTRPHASVYRPSDPAAVAIRELEKAREAAIPPGSNELEGAIDHLKAALSTSDIRFDKTLSADRRALLELFDYAAESWLSLEVAALNRLQYAFGEGYVAPTAIGNVAQSMQNYALSRYGLNLDTLWTRLQTVLQENKDFYPVLQDAKTQLDFLVCCVWLSAVTWLGWFVALALGGHSWGIFLAVSTFGPASVGLFYLLALNSYASLADLIRSGVDLYRFSLLGALHLPLPSGLRQERALWEAFRRHSSFGQEVEISYDRASRDKRT